MKVIFCLNHFLPGKIAGTEIYVNSLIRELGKMDVEGIVLIPNYNSDIKEEYIFENTRVIKYPEPSVTDRSLIMGKRNSDGLPFFLDVLNAENPDIVHFHELAGSNGISYAHVAAAKVYGFKTVLTFHLTNYSCKTGHLMYKDASYCDGIIMPLKCTDCWYTVKKNKNIFKPFLYAAASLTYKLNIDATKRNSRLGTALGFPFVIKRLKTNLLDLSKNCDAFVVLAGWYKNILQSNGIEEEKIVVIPQSLPAKIEPVETKNGKDDTGLKIIFVGRLSPLKGIHILIKALKQLNREEVVLDIFGQNADSEYVACWKKETASMGNIKWKGIIKQDEMHQTLKSYDLLCLPSCFSEMAPLVIQEAFAAKVPVLASDVYGNAEQIKENVNGWLFRFKDAEHLREKLQMLAADRSLIKKASANIQQVRTFSETAAAQKAVYEKILNRG